MCQASCCEQGPCPHGVRVLAGGVVSPQASWTELQAVIHAAEEVASCSDQVAGGAERRRQSPRKGSRGQAFQVAGGSAWEAAQLAPARKFTVMGLRRSKEGRPAQLLSLLAQSSGRVSGRTKSKVAGCPGVPTLQTVRFGGITGSSPWEQAGKPLHLGGEGTGGRQGLLTQLRRTATCQRHPPPHPHLPDLRPLPRERLRHCLPVLAQASWLCCPFKGA